MINLNSNIPTNVIGEKVIKAETPGLVSLAEAIASSQDLANKVSAFVGIRAHAKAANGKAHKAKAGKGSKNGEPIRTRN